MKKKIRKKTKNILPKINIKSLMKTGRNDCKYMLNKEGKIIRSNKKIDIQYRDFICVLNNKYNFDKVNFPYLYGNDIMVIKKLLIINEAKKENLKYVLLNTKNNKELNKEIIIFKDNNLESYCISSFLKYIKNIDEQFYREFYAIDESKEENIIKYFASEGIQQKLLKNKISNEEILTILFYSLYIFFIQKELKKKYGYDLKDFKNYHQLYNFLKINGYVKLFYKNYGPKIIKLISIFIQKIKSHNMYYDYINYIRKNELKSFKDISLYDLLDEYLPTNLNKNKIWNLYKKITKRNNIF